MSASQPFENPEDFSNRLKKLHTERRTNKGKSGSGTVRKSLTAAERKDIYLKTHGRCHICGGTIDGPWEADHVFSHVMGGMHDPGNYLPAHPICNNYRWFYSSEEIQWILKLGVWLRTQIENRTVIGRLAAAGFCKHEKARARRTSKTAP